MNIGLIGLQDDGWRTALQLKDAGLDILVYDDDPSRRSQAANIGFQTSPYVEEFAFTLESKRLIWIFIPEENTLDEILERLTLHLSVSDIIIVINPSDLQKTTRRYQELQGFQIDFLDCSFYDSTANDKPVAFVGGNRFAFNYCEKMFEQISHVQYCGLSGTGISKKEKTIATNR